MSAAVTAPAEWRGGICLLPVSAGDLELLIEAIEDCKKIKAEALDVLRASGMVDLQERDVGLVQLGTLSERVNAAYQAEPEH